MRIRALILPGLVVASWALLAAQEELKIVVIAGEDAVNVIQQRTAVAPIIEVRDRNDNPVAGVLVTFSIQGGQNATFGSGLSTLTLTTNAAGRAAAVGFSPTASGAVQINVAATLQGQSAAATIAQTNFATAAQAAQASASGAGSGAASGASSGGSAGGGTAGGGIGPVGISAIAGGAVGGFYTYRKIAWGPSPEVEFVSASTAIALLGTVVHFGWAGNTGGGVDWTEHWDYGDGTTETKPGGLPAPHVFRRTGTFNVSVTIEDPHGRTARGGETVTVKDLNGRWMLGTTSNFFDFTQSASAIGGTFTTIAGPGSGTVIGIVEENINARVTFNVVPTSGGASSFVGFAKFSSSGDVLSGTISGAFSATLDIRRQ